MRAQLPNGTIIEGTPSEIAAYLGKNPAAWYHSSSQGWVRIAEMHSNHLRNAILKTYREWLNGLSPTRADAISHKDFVKEVRQGITDVTLVAMLVELERRRE